MGCLKFVNCGNERGDAFVGCMLDGIVKRDGNIHLVRVGMEMVPYIRAGESLLGSHHQTFKLQSLSSLQIIFNSHTLSVHSLFRQLITITV